jgi:hypothetical protein
MVVDPKLDPRDAALVAVIATDGAAAARLRSHCRRRTPWWALNDVEVPAAFFPYMSGTAPRLVENKSKCTCTNAIHRVSWDASVSKAHRAGIVASTWTTWSGVVMEALGRHYGGGVLKVEPSAAKNALVVPTDGIGLLAELEAVCRDRGQRAARQVADEYFAPLLGLDRRDLEHFRTAAVELERLRAVSP